MARFKVGSGIADYIKSTEALLFASHDMMGRAIYEGAKIVVKEVAKGIDGLTVQNTDRARGWVDGITSAQKAGLRESLGIARMRSDGNNLNVKIGFDGYNRTITDTWPKGQPNVMIARSLETGTSFMAKQPFVSNAIRASKARAEQAMGEEFDRQVKEKMGF